MFCSVKEKIWMKETAALLWLRVTHAATPPNEKDQFSAFHVALSEISDPRGNVLQERDECYEAEAFWSADKGAPSTLFSSDGVSGAEAARVQGRVSFMATSFDVPLNETLPTEFFH